MDRTNCNACKGKIVTLEYLECMGCSALYDISCIGVTVPDFLQLSQETKENWICPECLSTRPKLGNINTPVRAPMSVDSSEARASLGGWNTTYVSEKEPVHNYNNSSVSESVNMVRGAAFKSPKDDLSCGRKEVLDCLNQLRIELSEMRLQNQELPVIREEIKSMSQSLNDMALTIKQLQLSLKNRDVEIIDLKNSISKLEKTCNSTFSKAKVTLSQPTPSSPLPLVPQPPNNGVMEAMKAKPLESVDKNVAPLNLDAPITVNRSQPVQEPQRKSKKETYASCLSTGIEKSGPPRTYSETVATTTPLYTNYERSSGQPTNSVNWELVTNKKKRTEVKKGCKKEESRIKGLERKKHLHVWRLLPSTTDESLTNYVKEICGKDVDVKVIKIKTKTKRDYVSYVISVPESSYDMLCSPEVWAVDVEFAEWIWFRTKGTTEKMSNQGD